MVRHAHHERASNWPITRRGALWLVAILTLPPLAAYAAPPPLTATTFIDLVKSQRPVVVSISALPPAEGQASLPQDHPAVPNAETPPSQSVGTGLLINPDGLILTNNHVIDRSGGLMVTLWDGRQLPADVVGRDAKTDLALIRLTPPEGETANFPAARLGDSDAAQVGEWVAAIGNPFGLDHTLTIGILSGKGRALGTSPYEEYLQTDASINPGSSGGPLFNIAGDVIGLTTAINPSGQGIGFAIPINQIKLLLPQLQQGKVRRGWIGVMIQPNPQPNSMPNGSNGPNGPADSKRQEGVVVTDVMPEGPAARAGLTRGDVIVEFDGVPIGQVRDLPRRVAVTEIGKKVPVKLLRKGQPLSITVTIGELKE